MSVQLVPGPLDEWFDKFEEHHSQLTCKIPHSIDSTRITQATDHIVDDFFNTYSRLCLLTFILMTDVISTISFTDARALPLLFYY